VTCEGCGKTLERFEPRASLRSDVYRDDGSVDIGAERIYCNACFFVEIRKRPAVEECPC